MNKKNGFTLIELLVTISLMTIFSIFALRMVTHGFVLHQNYRARSALFFEETVKSAKAERYIREHRILCDEEGKWSFREQNSDSLKGVFPYKGITCVNMTRGRVLLFTEGWSGLGQM